MDFKLFDPEAIIVSLELDEIDHLLRQLEWYLEAKIFYMCVNALTDCETRLEEFDRKHKPKELDKEDKARLDRYKKRFKALTSRQFTPLEMGELFTIDISSGSEDQDSPGRRCGRVCGWLW
jgi:hypothetical protein